MIQGWRETIILFRGREKKNNLGDREKKIFNSRAERNKNNWRVKRKKNDWQMRKNIIHGAEREKNHGLTD